MKSAGSERRSRTWSRAAAPLYSILLFAGIAQLRFAFTRSLPRGVYLALPAPQRVLRGDIVTFCAPPAWARRLRALRVVGPGRCPGGVLPLAKRVTALSPQVCALKDGILVNGRLSHWPVLPQGVSLGRFRFCGPTPPDCLFVLGDTPDSIDSRTFGCIPKASVLNRIVPLLTEES